MLEGYDISQHNGEINFNELKNNGVGFVIPRVGYGCQDDAYFKKYVSRAKQAGINIPAIYLFDYALNDQQALEEAEYAVAKCKEVGLSSSTIIFFDCEYDSVEWANKNGADKSAATIQRHTRLFADKVKSLGYQAGYYANLDWMNRIYNQGKDFEDLYFWYARYGHEPEYPCTIWQYSASGCIPGINTLVDMNQWMQEVSMPSGGESLKKINPRQWIDNHIGKIYDFDGVYGVQCVDLYKMFLNDIGYPNPKGPIGGDGWAQSIWYNRSQLGLGKYFEFIQGELKIGDIVIWAKGAKECPDSHVAMYVDDADGVNRGLIFGSNQGTAHSTGMIMSLSCDGSLGALRYKGFVYGNEVVEEKPSEPIKIQEGKKGSVYRLYNPNNGDHLYTVNLGEAKACQIAGWIYEGIAWVSPESGDPVFRFYNSKTGRHLYTSDQNEKEALVKAEDWKIECTAFLSGGGKPIYRLYNPNSGQHVLTALRGEHDALSHAGWYCEGQDIKH